MGIKQDRFGEGIVPIMKGHLAIPTTERKYRILNTITVTITKKDLDSVDKMIAIIRSKNENLIHIANAMFITKEFPDVLYKKIKKHFPSDFSNGDFFVIDHIECFDNDTMTVHLDCLEELKHIEIEE